jgi:predicted porin
MKKVLLATTALVSAGVLAGASEVAAQDKPISLQLGGYYRSAFAVNSDDDGTGQRGAGRRNHRITQDVEVHFKGETTLANGLTIGAVVELEAQEQNGDQVDETWAYIKGRWGELRYGDEDSVTRLSALSAPYPLNDTMFGANSPFFTFSNNGIAVSGTAGPGTNTTALDLTTDSSKLLYFTPRISGFQASVSYAPDGTQDCRTSNGGSNGCGAGVGVGRLKTDGLGQVFAIQGNYSGKIGPVDANAMIGYSKATNEVAGLNANGTKNSDPSTYLAGLQLGYNNWWIGGSYQKIDDGAGNQGLNGIDGRRASTFDVGIAYNPGPWGVALQYSRGDYTINGTVATTTVKDKLDNWALVGAYVLGPGIRLNAGLEYMKYDPGLTGVANYDSKAFLIGSTFIF